MPPKKGAKAKVSAKAASSAADANLGEDATATLPENLNLDHDAEINRAIDNILACPAFSDILSAAPIGINTGAHVEDHLSGHKDLLQGLCNWRA